VQRSAQGLAHFNLRNIDEYGCFVLTSSAFLFESGYDADRSDIAEYSEDAEIWNESFRAQKYNGHRQAYWLQMLGLEQEISWLARRLQPAQTSNGSLSLVRFG